MPTNPFKFNVIERAGQIPPAPIYQGFLIVDGWDDWFKYSTLYTLVIFTSGGVRVDCGYVKIGQVNQSHRRPELAKEFSSLGEDFFSLGQGDEYYEELANLDPLLRDAVVK